MPSMFAPFYGDIWIRKCTLKKGEHLCLSFFLFVCIVLLVDLTFLFKKYLLLKDYDIFAG